MGQLRGLPPPATDPNKVELANRFTRAVAVGNAGSFSSVSRIIAAVVI